MPLPGCTPLLCRFGLREKAGAQPQTYALGLKEVWEVSWRRMLEPAGLGLGGKHQQKALQLGPYSGQSSWHTKHANTPCLRPTFLHPSLPQVAPEKHKPGLVVHAVGHPLPWDVYGGSFIYHMPDNRVALGCGQHAAGVAMHGPAAALPMCCLAQPQ